MTTWQEIIQRYHIRHHNKIAKISEPLQSHFHITCVDYLKIYHNGKFLYLTNRPDCAEYYATEQLFRTDPYFRHPDTHRTGLFLMKSFDSNDNQKISEKFNLHFPLVLAEKTVGSIELLCFSGEKAEALEALQIQHPALLKFFAMHYKKELCKLLHQMEEESLSLINLQGSAFYKGLDQTPVIDTKSLHACLIALGKTEAIQKAASLSKRERDCLRLLIHGNSTKDVATELHLSSRTVESYLENVKDKLNCYNRRELISIADDFESLGLL